MPATSPNKTGTAMLMNHHVIQYGGRTTMASELPRSFHTPSSLAALTWNSYWPTGSF